MAATALDEDEGERQSSRRSHEMDELPGGRPRQSRKDARRPESTYCARAFLVLVNVGGIIFGSLILYYGLRAYVRLKAEQDINGVTKIVIKRSFQEPIDRVLIIAGTAQATPEIKGTTDLPFRPNRRINLSIMNITRDM